MDLTAEIKIFENVLSLFGALYAIDAYASYNFQLVMSLGTFFLERSSVLAQRAEQEEVEGTSEGCKQNGCF